ncbi:MAG: ribosome biogenesis GTPase Der [Dehalococcoidia bacterium]
MTTPIIAIVGRPNVGKSSLFNRLAGRRQAIIEDLPGTTRDRVSASIRWQDRAYTIVDTGGLELAPDSDISESIRAQVEVAIEEADAIVMLVDSKDGLTVPDREIAEMLRRSKKPVVPAVNKCDNLERAGQAFEFYQLPLDEPVAISALHNFGIAELMDRVTASIPEFPEFPEEEETLKIAILGRPNAGKSMLLNTLLGQKRAIVSETPGTTRDSIDTIVERDGVRALLIDTAGIRRRGRIDRGIEKYSVMRALKAIDRADVCLLMLDASEMVTAQDAHIAGYIREAYKGIILVINKWDLADELALTRRDAMLEVKKGLKFLHYASTLFISAKTGFGIDKVLPEAEKIHQARTRQVDPAELREAIRRAFESHPPMTKRFFNIRDVVQEEIGPPTFVFEVNNPALVHFSYRRYLENSLRNAFDMWGTPLKLVFKKKLSKKVSN